MGERVAVLEQQMAETRDALKMYTSATQAFTEAVKALNTTISRPISAPVEAASRGGGLRDWKFLAILAVVSAGGGGTAKLLDVLVKALGGP